jgi:hypothetical protein
LTDRPASIHSLNQFTIFSKTFAWKASLMIRNGLIASGVIFSSMAFSTILPPNDLYLEDNMSFVADMTEAEFMTITNQVVDLYKPVVQAHGAILSVNAKWSDSTVNASAQQSGTSWVLNMYGGLARRPEVTKDGYAMVICHELGHHLGGFPFVSSWAGDEGQADYFATQACAVKLWSTDFDINATARETVEAKAKDLCDSQYTTEGRQNLCYRTAMAGKSLATLLGALGRTPVPEFGTPDSSVVTSTNHSHPKAQCRLDTYTAGALCTVQFNDALIPGKGMSGEQGEIEANTVSCAEKAGFTVSARSHCWFKAKVL